jgi:1-acyl-sn-glycerol-3-phosphate acyltransferase
VIGKENIPETAGIVCSNHSSNIDPFLIAFAFGLKEQMHIIAKAELFKIPVISQILKKLGMISVNRGVLDAAAVKATMTYLKNGKKIVIFPEGTRVLKDDAIAAKTGAVKVAERAGIPIIPLFLPRKKPLFRKMTMVIGEPYYIEKKGPKRTMENYTQLSDEMMEKIFELKR